VGVVQEEVVIGHRLVQHEVPLVLHEEAHDRRNRRKACGPNVSKRESSEDMRRRIASKGTLASQLANSLRQRTYIVFFKHFLRPPTHYAGAGGEDHKVERVLGRDDFADGIEGSTRHSDAYNIVLRERETKRRSGI
jgi:hypothetical protein